MTDLEEGKARSSYSIIRQTSVKRKREDQEIKRPRKRVKSKVEDGLREVSQRVPKCGYCGIESPSLQNSGLCDKCHADIREGNGDNSPAIAASPENLETSQAEKEKQVNLL